MSSRSHKQKRLRLFEQGNDRCPICLTSFTRQDVELGEVATLEHVPPKSFKVGSTAMCLTCSDCNNSAGRAEHAAVEARREPKVRIEMPGFPIQTGRASVDASGSVISIRMSRSQASRDAIIKMMDSPRPQIKAIFRVPSVSYASVPWLKAAYLSVFSLLGVHGYRYAEGEAIERVRKQIMNPKDEVIRHFAFQAPSTWREKNCIVMNRTQTPCWAVKMGDCIVLLPKSWDQSLYERTDKMPSSNVNVTIGDGPLWYPVKFGDQRVGSIAFSEGYHPRETLDKDLFGLPGQLTQGDKIASFFFADYSGQEVTVIVTEGLGEDRE